jgi:hypothetical protein
MSLANTIDVPLRTVVNGTGFWNLSSPNTTVNPSGWLLLRQFTRKGKWYPVKSFPITQTYSALLWFVRARHAIANRNAGHDGVRIVFADGSLVADYVKFSAKRTYSSGGGKAFVEQERRRS